MIYKTLQEIVNFFDMAAARDLSGKWCLHELKPYSDESRGLWSSDGRIIELDFDDYSGDWRESLTLPDSWPKEPPFKDGELVFNCQMNGVMVWRDCYGTDVFRQCRHLTKEEWKVLKGEE